jgi:O-antigen/teichoic acid export membrane protein
MSGLHLTHSRRVARNSLLSFGASILGLVVGVIAVPLIIDEFGLELFGVLTITWILITNLAWLDLGLARATGRYVARELGSGTPEGAAAWAWTALVTQACLGAVAVVAIWFALPLLVDALGVSAGARDNATFAFQLFALSIPIEFAARSQIGVLEAAQRFGLSNALSLLGSVGTYVAGLLAIAFGQDFRFVVATFFSIRVLTFVCSFFAANMVIPLTKTFRLSKFVTRDFWERAKEMTRFGGLSALALLLGLSILYFDQWFVGVLLTVAVLPFYTVPFNLQSRLSIIPGSIIRPLAPAFSALESRQEFEKIGFYYLRAHRYLFFTLVPIFFLAFVWAPEILELWISKSFADSAATTMRILALGFVVSLLAPLSGALLTGIGRPGILVKIYVVELPLTVVAVVILTHEFGIEGAAWAYVLRSFGEAAALWFVAARLLSFSRESLAFAFRLGLQAACTLVLIGTLAVFLRGSDLGDPRAILVSLLVLAGYVAAVLVLVLDRADWRFLRTLARREQIGGA